MDVTIKSLFREPCAVKAAYPVLTGGLGRRTVRQRALILPTWNVDVSTSSRLMLRSSRHTAYRPWGDRRAGSPGATGRPGKEVDPLDRSLAIRQVTKEKNFSKKDGVL